MALNFSHRQIFPSHLLDEKIENLVSPMKFGNNNCHEKERKGDGFYYDYKIKERGEKSQETNNNNNNDVIDLLPSDPFGMDISTTVTAITGWLEDLEVDCRGYNGNNRGHYDFFAGLNFIWNSAVQFQAFPGNFHFGEKPDLFSPSVCKSHPGTFDFGEKSDCSSPSACKSGDFSRNFKFGEKSDIFSPSVCKSSHAFTGNFMFGEKSDIFSQSVCKSVEKREEVEKIGFCGGDDDDGYPHHAIFFSLRFLGIKDLLSVDRVCKSLHSAVRTDPLLWRNVFVEQPLNEKISDDVLLQLANRAQGSLQSLSLVECPRITDDGLRDILEANPKLTKLCVPGCTRLSIEGVVDNLKAFNSKNRPGIKHLRIGGLHGITEEHFEELKLLLGVDVHTQQNGRKSLFYHKDNLYLSCDDDRAIDIETCRKCQKLRLVYNCPSEGCQEKGDGSPACRACRLCIPRCVQCGCCINDSEYEETFCLDWLCSDCSSPHSKVSDGQDANDNGGQNDGVPCEPESNPSVHG